MVTIIKDHNDHSHFPDPADTEKWEFRTGLKTSVVVADEPPCETTFPVQKE